MTYAVIATFGSVTVRSVRHGDFATFSSFTYELITDGRVVATFGNFADVLRYLDDHTDAAPGC